MRHITLLASAFVESLHKLLSTVVVIKVLGIEVMAQSKVRLLSC